MLLLNKSFLHKLFLHTKLLGTFIAILILF
jgi:hypothetical protein